MLTFTGVNPSIGDTAVAEVRSVEKATFWAAVEVSPVLQETLAKLDANQVSFPDLKAAVDPLKRLRAASFSVEYGANQKVKFRVAAHCANAADAQQMRTALQKFWDSQGKMLAGMGKTMIPGDAQGAVGPLVDEVVNSLKVTNAGSRVDVALEVSEQTLQRLQAEGAALAANDETGRHARPAADCQPVRPRRPLRPPQ